MSQERCEQCNRRFDRLSFYAVCAAQHSQPTHAQRLVEEIEREIHGRKWIGWRECDDEIIDDIRDALVAIVARYLSD